MKKVKVAICNERFLARFGVDRILIRLAEAIHEEVELSLYYVRADHELISSLEFTGKRFDLPSDAGLLRSEQLVQDSCRDLWRDKKPDVVIVGGWPFFSIARLASRAGVKSIFLDAGAVPHNGMQNVHQSIQRELRRIRHSTLAYFDAVLPISDFIRDSQTLLDRGSSTGVHTVLLGADHLIDPDKSNSDRQEDSALVRILRSEIGRGTQYILLLGRFEGENYKNSKTSFDLLRYIIQRNSSIKMLVLAGGEHIDIPEKLRSYVTLLDKVSDAELVELMRLSVIGISTSIWEGFNLPLVEMQSVGRPVLAFSAGAHAEVIAHPWYLCASLEEMALKAVAIISNPSNFTQEGILLRKTNQLSWMETLSRWKSHIFESSSISKAVRKDRLVLVDVSNACQDPANSGVMRVTRRLSLAIQASHNWDVVFIKWSAECQHYILLSHREAKTLSSNAGPVAFGVEHLSEKEQLEGLGRILSECPYDTPAVMMLPEVTLDGSLDARIQWCSSRKITTVGIIHDLIPYLHPALVSAFVRRSFPDYVSAMVKLDVLISVSDYTLELLQKHFGSELANSGCHVQTIWLPAQFSDRPRKQAILGQNKRINILCVGTIEPRKNHLNLLKAFGLLRSRRPDLPVFLTLVGNAYSGGESLFEEVMSLVERDENIEYCGILSDDELEKRYQEARFTVYPSLMEGFGIPIVESLWQGKPTVCHNDGVMLELARKGGCSAVDMTDIPEISGRLELLCENDTVVQSLCNEISNRHLSDWRSYANDVQNAVEKTFKSE